MYQTSNYNFHVPDTPSSIFQQLKLMADDIDAALQTVDGGGGTGGGGYINPTTGYIPVRSSATSFADSLINDTGSSININGPVSITGGLTVNGQPIIPPTPHPVTSVFGRTGVIDSQLGDYPATKGGTGWGSYVIGDILFADSATTLARLADKATFFVLISGGIGVAPSWGKVNLNNAVTGLLPVTSGGTGTATVFTAGSVVFARAAGLYTENNAQFFWDNTNFRHGIGTATPQRTLDVNGDVLVSAATANLFLKDVFTGWVSGNTTIVNPQPNNSVRSTSFTSGIIGWNINALGDAEFNNVSIRGELRTSVFKVNEIAATAGTFGVFYSASTLTADCTTAASYGTNFTFIAKNSDVTATARLFSVGDIIRMKAFIGQTGVVIADSWATIASWVNNGPTTTYTATLNSGSGSTTFRAGTAVLDYGPSGTGFITLSTDGTVGSTPNMTMAVHAGSPWSAFTTATRVGNLNGSYGYASTVYGFGAGQYGGSGFSTITWTPVNVVGGTFTTGVFTKNAANGWANSGFSSSVAIVGDGYIEWTMRSITQDGWMVGLSYSDPNTDYVTINFAWHISGGNVLIYNLGGGGTSYGPAVANTTVLRIQRSGTTITWYKDGVAQYSMACTSAPLYLDTSVYSTGGQINPVAIYSSNTFGWVTVDNANGVRIGSGTTTRISLLPDGSGYLANNNISWTSAGVMTIAGWTINQYSISSGATYIASNFDIPAGQVAWFGKSVTFAYSGWYIRDAAGRGMYALVGNQGIYPYMGVTDTTKNRITIGGLNYAFGSDGATDSVGMKIWDSAGGLLVRFSDAVANGGNMISGWTIATNKITSGTIELNSSTGTISVASGNVTLDANGLTLLPGSGTVNRVNWGTQAYIYGTNTPAGTITGYGIGPSATSLGVVQFYGQNSTASYKSWLELRGDGVSNYAASALHAYYSTVNAIKLYIYADSTQMFAGLYPLAGTPFKGMFICNTTGPIAPSSNTLLDLQGIGTLVLPRMTVAQRNALSAANGAMVFNTDGQVPSFVCSGAWRDLCRGVLARVSSTVNLACPNNVITLLNFNDENLDPDGMWDSGFPSGLAVRAIGGAGTYLIHAQVQMVAGSPAVGYSQLSVRKNRSAAGDVILGACTLQNTGNHTSMEVSTIATFNVNDYVELQFFTNCGATVQLAGASPQTPQFWITKLSSFSG